MSSVRLLTRAVVASTASLALVTGLGGGTAFAQPRSEMSTQQRCSIEKQDVAKAKNKLKKAKQAKRDRQAKVAAAEQHLTKQKKQKTKWCNAAKSETAAQEKGTQRALELSALLSNPLIDSLPAEVRAPLVAALTSALHQVETLLTQVPGAEQADLSQIVNNFDALDVANLESALTGLAAQLQVTGGDPDAVLALITSLLGELPAGASLPSGGDLGQLQSVLTTVIGQLEAFDPSGSAGQLQSLVAQLTQATSALQGGSSQLQSLFTQFSALGGVPTDPAQVTALLGALLGGNTDLLPFSLSAVDLTDYDALSSLLGSFGDLFGGASTPSLQTLFGPLWGLIELLLALLP